MKRNSSIHFDQELDEAAIDRWHDGAFDRYRGKPKASSDEDYLKGWAHAEANSQNRVAMPDRPEGYYHLPVGAFD